MSEETTDEVVMRAAFESKLEALLSSTQNSTTLISEDIYQQYVAETKEAKERRRNVLELNVKHYLRLNRFDVMMVGDNDKLIKKQEDSSSIIYYCPVKEMFDVLHLAKLGHKREKAMEMELKRKYCNITREVTKLYLSLCQPCGQKKKSKEKGLVVKPMVMYELNSRCQVSLKHSL